MRILAIDTATEACSAAVLSGEEVFELYQVAPREHNRLILPMVEEVLATAGHGLTDLDAVAFGRGPGAFTGVRIAAGVAQGLAYGAGLPVVPVSTLAALAVEALEASRLSRAYACIDARMGEVYWGIYDAAEDGGVLPCGGETVIAPGSVAVPDPLAGVGAGSGWGTYGPMLRERLGARVAAVLADRLPRAAAVARLAAIARARGGAVAPEQALPVYLRDQVARKPGAA